MEEKLFRKYIILWLSQSVSGLGSSMTGFALVLWAYGQSHSAMSVSLMSFCNYVPSFNELRRLKDSLPDGSMHKIADKLNVTVQTVRNYFGGSNYEYGKNMGVHIEPGPDGGIVVLDDPTIYDMAVEILKEQEAE